MNKEGEPRDGLGFRGGQRMELAGKMMDLKHLGGFGAGEEQERGLEISAV